MRILDYLRNMVSSITKDELKEKLRILSQSLQKALEAFMGAESVLTTFKSKAGQQFEDDLSKTVRLPPRMTPVAYIRQVLTNMGLTLEMIQAIAEKSYGKDITIEGITYRRAELLRTIGYMDFVASYSTQLLHYLLVAEAAIAAKDHAPGSERPRPELQWLKTNQAAFFSLLVTFSKPSREITKLLESIPDIVIGEDDDKIIAPQVGFSKLDPLRNNFIPGISNTSLSIGIWWVGYQVAKYERLKEDVRSIELRLEQLRLQNEGKSDAQLERTIATYERYLNDTSEKVAKMEAKYT